MNPACEAIWSFLGIEVAECGDPAVGQFRRMCVHEHLLDGWLCREHADWPEGGLCRTCATLGGDLSHECPIVITPLESVSQQGGAA